MNLEVAQRVRYLRIGPVIHSWRRIATIICDEFPDRPAIDGWDSSARGNQMYGQDLCREAEDYFKLVSPTRPDVYVSWDDIIEERLKWSR